MEKTLVHSILTHCLSQIVKDRRSLPQYQDERKLVLLKTGIKSVNVVIIIKFILSVKCELQV